MPDALTTVLKFVPYIIAYISSFATDKKTAGNTKTKPGVDQRQAS